MYPFIRWIFPWPSSLLAYIFDTLPSVQGKIRKKKDIESGRDVCTGGVSLRVVLCFRSLISCKIQEIAITKTEESAPIGRVEHNKIKSKGEFISGGASGLVERLPSGDAVKSAWPSIQANPKQTVVGI